MGGTGNVVKALEKLMSEEKIQIIKKLRLLKSFLKIIKLRQLR